MDVEAYNQKINKALKQATVHISGDENTFNNF